MRNTAIPLSSRYRRLAGRIQDGHRETPQRFRPLAWRLAREPADVERIWSLYGWILRHLLAEFREDPRRSAHLARLLQRARALNEERFSDEEMDALQAEVRALAPRLHRRRSARRHGQIATDRVLLVLRTMLPTLRSIGTRAHGFGVDDHALALAIELTVAYYVADYDYDHFVMAGPQTAERLLVIALWCQGNMVGNGLSSMGGQLA